MARESSVLSLRKVRRTFPGVVALDGVDFDLRPGEIHALVGENGAGKSTLINLISGVLAPDDGELWIDAKQVRTFDPVHARQLGIVTVHQEADYFPTLSVAENMALLSGLPTNKWNLVDWPAVHHSAQASIDAVGEPIAIKRSASELSIAQRHMIQIAAAVVQRAKVVILDEPTSALTSAESEWLFEQIQRLKDQGAGIVYISHRQEEIERLADRVTVLRDGRRIWTLPCGEVTRANMIQAMVGRSAETTPSERPPTAGEVRLQVTNLTDRNGRFREISFDVKSGEILGIYGFVGAGRTELVEAIFGLRSMASGDVCIDGKALLAQSPRDARNAGIGFVPEDRLHHGLFRTMHVRANLVISTLQQWSRWGALTNVAREKMLRNACWKLSRSSVSRRNSKSTN